MFFSYFGGDFFFDRWPRVGRRWSTLAVQLSKNANGQSLMQSGSRQRKVKGLVGRAVHMRFSFVWIPLVFGTTNWLWLGHSFATSSHRIKWSHQVLVPPPLPPPPLESTSASSD